MSETALETTSDADLPPRTWRGWWLSWPKWFRIGCWAALGLMIVQVAIVVALAIRIHYGLQPTEEIAAMSRPGVGIFYSSNYLKEPFRGFNNLVDGIKGRTNADVVGFRFEQDHGNPSVVQVTDTDLKFIGDHFTNLEFLSVGHGEITAEGLTSLGQCPRLRTLELSELDIDDSAAASLSRLPAVMSLDLTGTLVTDAAITSLKRLPKLSSVNLSYTDVSLAAIQDWRDSMPTGKLFIGTERDQVADAVLGSIRWQDGRRSAGFAGPYSRLMKHKDGTASESSNGLRRNFLWWPPEAWEQRGDGEYQFSLKLGEFESAPVTVIVKDGKPSANSIEFRMPCTKAQALISAKNPEQ